MKLKHIAYYMMFSVCAYAENKELLPTMVITAPSKTLSSTRIDDGHTSITPSPIYRTINDNISADPEIRNQSTGPQQQSLFVRGFTGYNNITLIDGIRINNSGWRSGPNQYGGNIDPYSIDHVDVFYGQSSMLYGADAYGAAVNFNTRRRTDLSADGFNWDRRVVYRYGSAENSNIGRAEIEGNYGNRVGFLIGTSIKGYGDMVGGKKTGTQPNTNYDEQDFDVKVDWYLTDQTNLTFAHQRYNSDDAWRNHRTISANHANNVVGASDGTYLYDILDNQRTLSYVKMTSIEVPFVDEFSTTLSYQEHEQSEQYLRSRSNSNIIKQGFNLNTIGFNIQAKNNTKFGLFTYGSNFYHDSVDSIGSSTSPSRQRTNYAPPIANNSTYDTFDLYISDDVPFWNDRGLFTITSRYTHVFVDVDGPIMEQTKQVGTNLQVDWNSVVFGGRLSIKLDENNNYTWFVGANQGWRAPTLVDLTGNSLSLSNTLQQPSVTIKPEKFVTYETGFGYTDDKLDAVIIYFRTELSDTITTDTSRADNAGHGYMQGVSFKSEYQILPQVKLTGGISWTEGYLTSYDPIVSKRTDNISKVTPITGVVGIRYDVTQNIYTEFNANLVDSQDKLATRDLADITRIPKGGSDGYSIYDIRIGWSPTKNFNVIGVVENLTNEDYRSIGSGVNGYGRNFVVGIDYKF